MSEFTPTDPDWETRIRESFNRQGFMATLLARLTRLEPALVEIETDFRPELTQQHGFFHARVTASLADTAGRYAGFSLFPARSPVPTADLKIKLSAPPKRGRLRPVARGAKAVRTVA